MIYIIDNVFEYLYTKYSDNNSTIDIIIGIITNIETVIDILIYGVINVAFGILNLCFSRALLFSELNLSKVM